MGRNRFPTSRLPEGWFPMGWEHELAPGQVTKVTAWNRELVLWRGESGEAYVQDAYCLHLGAHRGVGGWVVGDDLACPWHGWEWNGEGHNTRIPYSKEGCKPQLQIRSYPVRSWCGLVLAWYSDDPAKAPTWEPPEVPEYGHEDYFDMHPVSDQLHRIRAHPQMPVENACDPAHIQYVHGAGEVPTVEDFVTEGAWFQTTVAMVYGAGKGRTPFTPNGPVPSTMEMNAYGVGLTVVRWDQPFRSVQITGFVTVDDEYMDYYFAQCSEMPPGADRGDPTGLALAFADMQRKVVPQDFPIWENMNYLDRPHFAAEEAKSYSAMRRWAAQFYPDEDRAKMLAAAGSPD